MTERRPRTRIQEKNRATILEAALDVFSQHGFRGATLDQIATGRRAFEAERALLFPLEGSDSRRSAGRADGHLARTAPALDDHGDPVAELLDYVDASSRCRATCRAKAGCSLARSLQGAPRFGEFVAGPLKTLVDEKVALIRGWVDAGRIAPVDPYHLIFSIWATTQHYADFDTQVRAILEPEDNEHFDDARAFLRGMYAGLLRPDGAR